MALVRVRFKNGHEGVVGEEWADRWPEDIDEVLGPDDGTPLIEKPKKSGSARGASKPSKPAPEVPDTNKSTDKKET